MVAVFSVTWLFGLAFAQNNLNNNYIQPTHGGQTQNLAVIGAGTGKNDSFVTVVKNAVNWILGILALIALLVLLWGGFQMVTAAWDDEKYKKGFTILKQAAMGLILIGVAWFIISIIFWLVNLVAAPATDAGTGA